VITNHTPSASQAKTEDNRKPAENVRTEFVSSGGVWISHWDWAQFSGTQEFQVSVWDAKLKNVREFTSLSGRNEVELKFTTHDKSELTLAIWGMTRMELIKALLG
jgi:hypothetical protein